VRVKSIVLAIAKSMGGFRTARQLTRRSIRILCYHGTWLGREGFRGDGMFMSADTFRARLDHLTAMGYPVIALGTAVAELRDHRQILNAPVVITIDDGWYSTYSDMLPALARHGFPATLYCDSRHLESGAPVPHLMARYFRQLAATGEITKEAEERYQQAFDKKLSTDDRVAAAVAFGRQVGIDPEPYLEGRVFEYMTPVELRTFANTTGFTVELHTHRHTMGDHSAEVIQREIDDNRAALSRLLGSRPESFTHFCYPSGAFNRSDAAHLRSVGVASATSTQQGIVPPSADIMLLPRILDGENLSMLEFEAEISGFMHLLRMVTGRSRIGYDAPFS
jgi:peptidoglycan/xylan/chitin deacetylase (PgdA/CDA1 family)